MIQTLESQVQNLRRYISDQISELTAELRSVIAAAHTPPSIPSPTSVPPLANDLMNCRPILDISPPHDTEISLPNRQTIIVHAPTAAPLFSYKFINIQAHHTDGITKHYFKTSDNS